MRICLDTFTSEGRKLRKIINLPFVPVKGTEMILLVSGVHHRFHAYQVSICELPGKDNWQYVIYLETFPQENTSQLPDPPPKFDTDPTWNTI